MTEQIALFCLKAESEKYSEVCNECQIYGEVGCDHCFDDAMDVAINALEEIQQYRAIGTVDEVMELKKQNIALTNRCKILTKGQLCIFCPIRCEERAEKCRNVKGGGVTGEK